MADLRNGSQNITEYLHRPLVRGGHVSQSFTHWGGLSVCVKEWRGASILRTKTCWRV